MNRLIRILSRAALCGALASTASTAHAQQNYGRQYPNGGPNYNGQGNQNRANQNNGGATLPLPEGVSRVIGIDAQNTLLVELEPETPGAPSEYRAIPVRHVYEGGIARLFGGTTISTEDFVSPAFSKNGGGFGNMNNGGPGNFVGNTNGGNGFGQNNFNGGYPNGGLVPNGNNFVPNGYLNGALPNGVLPNGYNAGGNGNFNGASQVVPQVTYGVGNYIRSRQMPIQNSTTTTVTTQPAQ